MSILPFIAGFLRVACVSYVSLLRLTDEVTWPTSSVVRVPAGRSLGEKIRALDVDVTEVSREQFHACIESGRCTGVHFAGADLPPTPRTRAHPVLATRTQAQKYCEALGKRLPSEAEWEWIARGGPAQHMNPWTNAIEACDFAVLDHPDEGEGCGYRETWPVESMRRGATAQGVLHMAGNVSEWTSTSDAGWAIARGGNLKSTSDAGIFERWHESDGEDRAVGFRCVSESK